MAETLEPVTNEVDQQRLAEQLLAQAKDQNVELVGPNGDGATCSRRLT